VQKVSAMEADSAIKSLSSKDKLEFRDTTWLMTSWTELHLFDGN
jgi:hypothetical protein